MKLIALVFGFVRSRAIIQPTLIVESITLIVLEEPEFTQKSALSIFSVPEIPVIVLFRSVRVPVPLRENKLREGRLLSLIVTFSKSRLRFPSIRKIVPFPAPLLKILVITTL